MPSLTVGVLLNTRFMAKQNPDRQGGDMSDKPRLVPRPYAVVRVDRHQPPASAGGSFAHIYSIVSIRGKSGT